MRWCMGLAKYPPPTWAWAWALPTWVQPCAHHTHRLPPAAPVHRPRPRSAPGAMAQCVRELSGLDVGPLTAALAASDAPFAPSQLYDSLAETKLVDESLRRSRFRELADKSILDLCEPLVRRASDDDPLHDYMLVRNNATHIVYGVRAPGAQHGHAQHATVALPLPKPPAAWRAQSAACNCRGGRMGLRRTQRGSTTAGPALRRALAGPRLSRPGPYMHARHAAPAAGPLTQPPAHRPCTPAPPTQPGDFFKAHEDYLSLTSNVVEEYTMIVCVPPPAPRPPAQLAGAALAPVTTSSGARAATAQAPASPGEGGPGPAATCEGGETVVHLSGGQLLVSRATTVPGGALLFRKDLVHEGRPLAAGEPGHGWGRGGAVLGRACGIGLYGAGLGMGRVLGQKRHREASYPTVHCIAPTSFLTPGLFSIFCPCAAGVLGEAGGRRR
jgi:hypothetical protein